SLSRWLAILSLHLFSFAAGFSQQASEKLEEPDPSAQKSAEDKIQGIFKDEYATARRSAPEGKALAQKLVKYGTQERRGGTLRYLCFREARDLAAKAGDFRT